MTVGVRGPSVLANHPALFSAAPQLQRKWRVVVRVRRRGLVGHQRAAARDKLRPMLIWHPVLHPLVACVGTEARGAHLVHLWARRRVGPRRLDSMKAPGRASCLSEAAQAGDGAQPKKDHDDTETRPAPPPHRPQIRLLRTCDDAMVRSYRCERQ